MSALTSPIPFPVGSKEHVHVRVWGKRKLEEEVVRMDTLMMLLALGVKVALIDVDGTCSDTPAEVREYLTSKGYTISAASVAHEIVVEGMSTILTSMVSEMVFNQIIIPRGSASPIRATVERVNTLKEQGYVIVYFSARPEHLTSVTEKWLEDNGFPAALEVLCLGHPTKGGILASLPGYPAQVVVVDDNPGYLRYRASNVEVQLV